MNTMCPDAETLLCAIVYNAIRKTTITIRIPSIKTVMHTRINIKLEYYTNR